MMLQLYGFDDGTVSNPIKAEVRLLFNIIDKVYTIVCPMYIIYTTWIHLSDTDRCRDIMYGHRRIFSVSIYVTIGLFSLFL